MKLLVTLVLLFSFSFAWAQEQSPQPNPQTLQQDPSVQVQIVQVQDPQEKSGLMDSLAKHVRMEVAATWDGEEISIIRGSLEVHYDIFGRLEVFGRFIFLPAFKSRIVEKLNDNEDIILGVSAQIANGVRNAIALQSGRPVDQIVVSQAQLQAALADKLTKEVEKFVDSKVTNGALADAAVRELGLAVDLTGDTVDNHLVLEIGKIDPMYAQDISYFQNFFRVSRPAIRVKFAKKSLGIVVSLEVGNDNGIGEIAEPRANAVYAATATYIARSSGKFFDLTDVNSWEMTFLKSLGKKQKILFALGTRPVLDRGVDSKYLLVKYNLEVGGFRLYAQGSLEDFDDPVYGATKVKRYEGGLSKSIKGIEFSGSAYSRYDSLVRKDFSTVMGGFTWPLLKLKKLKTEAGFGARVYTYKYHGFDNNGDPYKWKRGGDVGLGFRFGEEPVEVADILLKQDREKNDKRLAEEEAAKNSNEKKSEK